MATRKDLKALAQELRYAKPRHLVTTEDLEEKSFNRGFDRAVDAVCRGLMLCNDRFNDDKFREAVYSDE